MHNRIKQSIDIDHFSVGLVFIFLRMHDFLAHVLHYICK
jgi:hypothetical protein